VKPVIVLLSVALLPLAVVHLDGQRPSRTALTAEEACTPIDFEMVNGAAPKEGDTIDRQFASQGVTFRLEPEGAPKIAQVGRPVTAFEGPKQVDTPAPDQNIGTFFLTDDGTLARAASPLLVTYDPPTAAASGVVLDVDFGESFTIEARNAAGRTLQTLTIKAGAPDTGDGIATRWAISRERAEISSIRFHGTRPSGRFGLGFDNFCARSSAAESKLKLSLDASVLFDFDKSDVKPEAASTLADAAGRVAGFAGSVVRIEGHTDNVGRPDYNQRLSEQRAATVMRYLQSQPALQSGFTFESVGFGDTRPTDDNGSEQGRARNRRVEIRVIEKAAKP
jgi:outer membrane protein OmpA-like peptidoglycan-associated protein